MIPDRVRIYTSATFCKNQKTEIENCYGTFRYKDIPKEVYPYYYTQALFGKRGFLIASKEKALCDFLCSASPIRGIKDFREYLFDGMRFDKEMFHGNIQWFLTVSFASTHSSVFHCLAYASSMNYQFENSSLPFPYSTFSANVSGRFGSNGSFAHMQLIIPDYVLCSMDFSGNTLTRIVQIIIIHFRTKKPVMHSTETIDVLYA